MYTEFERSLQTASEYPCNLVKTNNFNFTLRQQREKLSNEDVVIFQTKRWGKKAMTFFDYSEVTKGEMRP